MSKVYVPFLGRNERVRRTWVAKLKGDKNSECKLSNTMVASYKVLKLRLSAGK